jgi:hypothetical protein
MRWPEFGYGLKQRKDPNAQNKMIKGSYWFSPWRGPRDERAWPSRLAWNPEDGWPWIDDSEAGFYNEIRSVS